MSSGKPRFNVMDAFVVLFIFAALISVAVKLAADDAFILTAGRKQIEYVVLIEKIDYSALGMLVTGQTLRNAETGGENGTIMSFSRKNYEQTVRTEEGTLATVVLPKTYSLFITLRAEARVIKYGYILEDGTYVSPGTWLDLYNSRLQLRGIVVSAGPV